jgi:hypothetical protein
MLFHRDESPPQRGLLMTAWVGVHGLEPWTPSV